MDWVFDDGGRAEAGFKGRTRDCACRAIAIATEKPYKEVYDLINSYGSKERLTKKRKAKGRSNARTGVWKETFRKIMTDLGWEWVSTMKIGQGCKVHLRSEELPMGRVVCLLAHHYVAVIDGVIHDTYDPNDRVDFETEDYRFMKPDRCVYGYFIKKGA